MAGLRYENWTLERACDIDFSPANNSKNGKWRSAHNKTSSDSVPRRWLGTRSHPATAELLVNSVCKDPAKVWWCSGRSLTAARRFSTEHKPHHEPHHTPHISTSRRVMTRFCFSQAWILSVSSFHFYFLLLSPGSAV